MFVLLINCSSYSLHCSFVFVVCRDGSCSGGYACFFGAIGYVAGPSCSGGISCSDAKIGSVYKSCKDDNFLSSCTGAQLIGVDLINSCNGPSACYYSYGNGVLTELIGCCNNYIAQCQDKVGTDIVAAGGPNCVSYGMCIVLTLFYCLFICQMTHSSLILYHTDRMHHQHLLDHLQEHHLLLLLHQFLKSVQVSQTNARVRCQIASGRSQAKLVARSQTLIPSLARVVNEESLPRNYSSRRMSFFCCTQIPRVYQEDCFCFV